MFEILADVFTAFFFSVGVIYFTREALTALTRHKKKARAVILITPKDSKSETLKELIVISELYHEAFLARYIEKIVVIDPDGSFEKDKENFEKALRIPMEFKTKA